MEMPLRVITYYVGVLYPVSLGKLVCCRVAITLTLILEYLIVLVH